MEPELFPWGRLAVFMIIVIFIEVVLGTAEYGFAVTASEVDVLVGAILAVYLFWLTYNVNLRLSHTILLVWLNLFVIRFLNNIIEGYFFTDVYGGLGDLMVSLGYAALFSVFTALAVSLVYLFPRPRESVAANLKSTFARASMPSWIGRIILAGPMYFVIYFAFGMMVSPFITQYYNDPSLGLKIPSFSVMIPVELIRGIIFGLVLLPLLASMRFGRLNTFISISMMLFIPGALLPLIQSPLPAQILPFHIVEILGDSLVFTLGLMWLFNPRSHGPAQAARGLSK